MTDKQEITRSDGADGEGFIHVGKPDVRPDSPAHVKGVRQGNSVENAEAKEQRRRGRSPGAQTGGQGSARRSTGINPEDREPIDPRMPRLSPS